MTRTQEKRARKVVILNGDPVLYRGERWYYLRAKLAFVTRAVNSLERAGKLVRWSEKTRNVVRFMG